MAGRRGLANPFPLTSLLLRLSPARPLTIAMPPATTQPEVWFSASADPSLAESDEDDVLAWAWLIATRAVRPGLHSVRIGGFDSCTFSGELARPGVRLPIERRR